MTHGYQNRQGDGLWYWAIMHKVTLFFDHLIICSLMANKKRYISNSASPMDTKLDRVVAYDMEKTIKKHITFSKKIFPFMNFFSTTELYL